MTSRLLLLLLPVIAGLPVFAQDARPNIVWIVTEDNSTHYLRLYNPGGAPMPNVEALAARGMVFENAYSQGPVCSVARSTLISGMYAPRIGAQYHRKVRPVPMPEGTRMFPAYLRDAGYYTANNAKTDYNLQRSAGTWDASSPEAHYRDRRPGQPFFFVKNFETTHESRLHFPEADSLTVPTVSAADSVAVLPVHPDDRAFRYTRARYHDQHRKVDREIGEVLAELAADGLMDSTIIFYYGDHGGVLPGSKGYLYETGIHVPLVVYVPPAFAHLNPFGEDRRPEAFARFMDFGPTVLHLAGIPVPTEMDGRPFLGRSLDLPAPERDTVYGYADRFDAKSDMVRSVRIGEYKYIRSYQPYLPDGLYNEYRYRMWAYRDWIDAYRAGMLDSLQARFFRPRPAEMLFNLAEDPLETHDLAGDPDHATELHKLRRAQREIADGLPDLSFIPEPVFLEAGWEDPVGYGRKNASRIAELRRVADLQLLDIASAGPQIAQAMRAEDPLVRYWACIAASAFGERAGSLVPAATDLLEEEANTLVRVRAAEFLGLVGAVDPRDELVRCLQAASSPAEATVVLNTMSLFRYLHPTWEWAVDEAMLPRDWLYNDRGGKLSAARLLHYLRGEGTIK